MGTKSYENFLILSVSEAKVQAVQWQEAYELFIVNIELNIQ